jgi:hypothetical protein
MLLKIVMNNKNSFKYIENLKFLDILIKDKKNEFISNCDFTTVNLFLLEEYKVIKILDKKFDLTWPLEQYIVKITLKGLLLLFVNKNVDHKIS